MKPTLGIVSFLISDEYDFVAGFDPEDDVAFEECAAYNGDAPQQGTLYLADAPVGVDQLWRGKLAISLATESGQGAIVPGEHHVVARERKVARRFRPTETRFRDLVNAVTAAIRKFDRWALEEQRCGFGRPDFYEMLRLLEAEMGLVSILVNRNLRYLAASRGFGRRNPWYRRSDTSMEIDMTNQLMADEAFVNAINMSEPFFYHYLDGAEESYSACFNVRAADRYEARLLTQSSTGKKAYGQLALTSYLGELIADVFTRYADGAAEESVNPEFQRALAGIARGAVMEVDDLKRVLSVRGWSIDDCFVAHVFSFMSPENESVTRRYYQDRIAHLFSGCFVLLQDGVLYCVRDLNLEQRTPEEAAQDFVLFLRENLCHAGTSREFRDVRKLPVHLAEARCALRLGEKSGAMQWHFLFEDFALRYIFDQAKQGLGSDAVVHPAYRILKEHDEQHGTELLDTARAFMECKYNVTRTAQQLHIHRSSLLARLERIDRVAKVDWDDWDERIHLALSFQLEE